MHAYFDNDGKPKVSLDLKGRSGTTKTIEALLDTGHNGKLSLPLIDLIDLGAELKSEGPIIFGNGAIQSCLFFEVQARMDKNGSFENVLASYIGDSEAIAGAELFKDCTVSIDFKNKEIKIEPSDNIDGIE